MILELLGEQRIKFLSGLLLIAIASPLSNILVSVLFLDIFDAAVYDIKLVLPVIMKFLMLVLFLAVIIPCGKYLTDTVSLRITGDLREKLLRKIIKLDETFMTDTHSGDLISRSSNDILLAEKIYKEQIHQLFEVLLNGIGCALFMLWLDWRFSIMLILYQVTLLLVTTRFANLSKKRVAIGKIHWEE